MRSTSIYTSTLVCVGALLAACGDDPVEAPDTGLAPNDVGFGDVGPIPDSGHLVDGGLDGGDASSDTGTVDTGVDGGTGMDATPTDQGPPPPTGDRPVTRGGMYFGFPERFNRFYTDLTWAPTQTVYVSADGTGNGASRATPANASDTPSFATPGTKVIFLPGTYEDFCIELGDTESGTYDDPVVLEAELNGAAYLVHLNCCGSGRQTCINLEAASYVAIQGFEMQGGRYGIRSVGSGYEASNHARGNAAIGNHIYGQNNDPILTGASDWDVWQGNICHEGGPGDGHGIYLSNGSDWNIVRYNELYENMSADFQINADPASCCTDVGIAFDDPLCDAYAGTGEGGQGVSDYMLIENNFFHHGNAQGANFTSVRRSVVRNNIFAFYARHGVSFWQETDNPNLGSSDNLIDHNLFASNNQRQMIQFIVDSTRNNVRNNLFIGTTADAVWMETDATVGANTYSGNWYFQGQFGGDAPRTANGTETTRVDFDPAWFLGFPTAIAHNPSDYFPSATAPFLGAVPRLSEVTHDFVGMMRNDPTEPGPSERP